MKKDWKYILYLSIFIILYVVVQLLSPKSHNWSISLSHMDKDPYGTFVIGELLPDHFESIEITSNTFYELLKEQNEKRAILSFSTSLDLGKEDTESLLEYISKGNNALLSAHYFYGKLADTLNLNTIDYLFDNSIIIDQRDSISLHLSNPIFDTLINYKYRKDNVHNYFNAYDTLKTTVVARNDLGEPITLKVSIGQGALILNSTPMVFSNINMLFGENYNFASNTLSYLTQPDLVWTEYYHLGRMEARTPLRFVLSQEPLAWAYYIIVISLLLLILFESKRKQRAIPIIPPLQNTTLEFVSTIGNLYYQRADHKNIAEKKIAFFHETIKSQYNLEPALNNNISYVAKKTGNDENDTRALLQLIDHIQAKSSISSDELMSLNKRIENFLK